MNDFVDANMVMLAAARRYMRVNMDELPEEFSLAWDLAKSNPFYCS